MYVNGFIDSEYSDHFQHDLCCRYAVYYFVCFRFYRFVLSRPILSISGPCDSWRRPAGEKSDRSPRRLFDAAVVPQWIGTP